MKFQFSQKQLVRVENPETFVRRSMRVSKPPAYDPQLLNNLTLRRRTLIDSKVLEQIPEMIQQQETKRDSSDSSSSESEAPKSPTPAPIQRGSGGSEFKSSPSTMRKNDPPANLMKSESAVLRSTSPTLRKGEPQGILN